MLQWSVDSVQLPIATEHDCFQRSGGQRATRVRPVCGGRNPSPEREGSRKSESSVSQHTCRSLAAAALKTMVLGRYWELSGPPQHGPVQIVCVPTI